MKNWKKVTKLVNNTPHEVAVLVGDAMIRIAPSGNVVRLNTHCIPCGDVMGIPVVRCKEGEPKGLPEPEDGVVFIVSSVVAKMVKRADVVSPDTSDNGAIRDGNGYIIGVKQLQLFV